MKFVTALILFQLVSVSLGFQSSKSLSVCSTQQQQKQKRKATFLSVLPPVEHFHDMHSGLAQLTQQQSFWLADAADAVADGAVKEGWWQSYINLFKLALQSIHDTVDGPLQANGITNSWGISIALFTACKYSWNIIKIRILDWYSPDWHCILHVVCLCLLF